MATMLKCRKRKRGAKWIPAAVGRGLAISFVMHMSPAIAQGYSTPVSIMSVNARDIGTDVNTSGFSSLASCANTITFRITNDVTNGDMMRATVLTAFASGKPVKVWISGCAPDGVPAVSAVWVSP